MCTSVATGRARRFGDHSDGALDGFLGPHERRGAAPLQRKLLEQCRVDVGADAEREEPALPAQIGGALHDRVRTRLADGRRPVRQEQHERQPPRGRVRRHRLFERALDVRAAVRVEGVEILDRSAHVSTRRDRPSVAE